MTHSGRRPFRLNTASTMLAGELVLCSLAGVPLQVPPVMSIALSYSTFRGGPTNASNGSQNAGSVGAIASAFVISKKNASA
jgi:hypothetical protein